jgi:hypothetical protein
MPTNSLPAEKPALRPSVASPQPESRCRARYFGRHDDAALAILSTDLIRPFREVEGRELAQWDGHRACPRAALRQSHRQILQGIDVAARSIRQPHNDLEAPVAFLAFNLEFSLAPTSRSTKDIHSMSGEVPFATGAVFRSPILWRGANRRKGYRTGRGRQMPTSTHSLRPENYLPTVALS